MKALILILALLLSAPAFARIGETPEECIARYGTALKVDKEKNQLFFRKGEMVVIASFFEGKCDSIAIRKAEQDILGNPPELSDTELDVLMQANGGEKKWRKQEVLSMAKIWATEDGAVIAQYEPLERILLIYTKESLARETAEKEAKDKQKLDGF